VGTVAQSRVVMSRSGSMTEGNKHVGEQHKIKR
jgi:hypothetical protein